MKVLNNLVSCWKEAGIEGAELLIVKAYEGTNKAIAMTIADGEASATEKMVCGVVAPILLGFKAAVDSLADLNKDGKVG